MEILLQSHKIKEGNREKLVKRLQKLFFKHSRVATDAKQKNVTIEHVCGIEIKGQKSDAKQIYKYNCEPSISNDSVNKTTEQRKNKNVCPGLVRDGRPLTKSQSMPDFF